MYADAGSGKPSAYSLQSLSAFICVYLRFLFLVLVFTFAASHASAFDWTIVKENGRDYVPLTDLARFYDFNSAEFSNGVATLTCPAVHFQCASGSRDLYLNGLRFILSLPVLDIQDRFCISRLDLAKLVDPVLRPTKISASPVRTVVIDAGHGGADSGARGPLGNEKDFTLDVALRARDLFTRAGFNVRMTRSSDRTRRPAAWASMPGWSVRHLVSAASCR
jgi:N-acetylmuramoyl-L-alanine amidase